MTASQIVFAATGADTVQDWLRTDLPAIIMTISGAYVLSRFIAFVADQQILARAKVREQAGLRQARRRRQRADGQALKAGLANDVEAGVENRRPRPLALALHCPGHLHAHGIAK